MRPLAFSPALHEVEVRGIKLTFRVPSAVETQQLARMRRGLKQAHDDQADDDSDFVHTSALVVAYLWWPTEALGSLDTALPVLPADLPALRTAARQVFEELSGAGFTVEDLTSLAVLLEQRIHGVDAMRRIAETADFTGARRG